MNVVDSQKVKRGDVLVMIDDTDARLALRQAQADLARAQAQVIAAMADVERTGIDLHAARRSWPRARCPGTS